MRRRERVPTRAKLQTNLVCDATPNLSKKCDGIDVCDGLIEFDSN